MVIDEIVSQIPNSVASYIENIYITKDNIFYNIAYNGFELKISRELTIDEYNKRISVFNDDVISEIQASSELKKVYTTKENKEKLVIVDTINDYKVIYIIDITKQEVSDDKPILLIADDSPVITKFFTKIFKDQYEILVAADGNEAIKLVNDNMDKNIVGAFFDLQMPNKNGYEVLDYFKQNDLFKKIPVSIISGEDTADGIERATAYEVVDMLKKPFSAESAKAIVERTIAFSPKNK